MLSFEEILLGDLAIVVHLHERQKPVSFRCGSCPTAQNLVNIVSLYVAPTRDTDVQPTADNPVADGAVDGADQDSAKGTTGMTALHNLHTSFSSSLDRCWCSFVCLLA